MRNEKETQEERAEILQSLNGSYEQQQFQRGIELFDALTDCGKHRIEKETISNYCDEDLESLMLYCAYMKEEAHSIEDEIADYCVWYLSNNKKINWKELIEWELQQERHFDNML